VNVVLPDRSTLARFESHTSPVFELLDHALSWIRALARTRDLLLPRLVTGRLDISDVDLGDLLPAAETA